MSVSHGGTLALNGPRDVGVEVRRIAGLGPHLFLHPIPEPPLLLAAAGMLLPGLADANIR